MLTTDYFPNESIPTAMDRFNEPRRVRVVAERLAQFGDPDRKHAVADNRVRPDGFKERRFCHQLPLMFYEVAQKGEGFRGQC
jgi:hypothetical protein